MGQQSNSNAKRKVVQGRMNRMFHPQGSLINTVDASLGRTTTSDEKYWRRRFNKENRLTLTHILGWKCSQI